MWRDFTSHPQSNAQAIAEENLPAHGDQTPGEERFNLKLFCLFMLIFFFGSRSIPQSLPGSIPQSLPVSVCVCVFDLAVGVVTPMSSWLKYYLHLLFQLLTKLEAYPAIECRVQARTKNGGAPPLKQMLHTTTFLKSMSFMSCRLYSREEVEQG